MSRIVLAAALLAAAALHAAAGIAVAAETDKPPRLVSFGVEGGDFRAALSTGQVLRGADLVGAVINVAGTTPTDAAGPAASGPAAMLKLRIDTAEHDANGPAPDVWLFGLSTVLADGTATSFCQPDPNGRQLAIPYPTPGSGQGFGITCSSGAVGKCMRFGYRPWATGPGGASLAPLHAACVRMVRADYGGNDRPWTRNGMQIDLYDDLGIQKPDSADTAPFEAGWTPDGAVCVAHPRVPENGDLTAIEAVSPRLHGHTGPAACTEAEARAAGAVLFNRSAAK